MVNRRARVIAALAAPSLVLLVAPTLTASAPASAPASAATSAPASAPALSRWPGGLSGISTVSASHAWAIGNTETKGFLVFWNGRRWQRSSLVMPGRASVVNDVAARTANDIWVVGYYYPDSSGRYLALIEHWDGSGWHRVRAPISSDILQSVSADSATDAWAAGSGRRGALLMHWDGTRWNKPVGKVDCCRELRIYRAVTVISPTQAWAVGYAGRHASIFLTVHWNGVTWRKVPSAVPGGTGIGGDLESVSATSPTDVWAVGDYSTGMPGFRSFIEHWDGRAWTQVTSSPGHQRRAVRLLGVTANAGTDAWTVGYRLRPNQTWIDHWDGRAWSEVESSNRGVLDAVDASSPTNAWAVGGQMGHTLIEHWDGHTWSVS